MAWRPGASHEAIDFLPDSGQARGFLFFEKLGPFRKLYSRNPSLSRTLSRPYGDRLSCLLVNERNIDASGQLGNLGSVVDGAGVLPVAGTVPLVFGRRVLFGAELRHAEDGIADPRTLLQLRWSPLPRPCKHLCRERGDFLAAPRPEELSGHLIILVRRLGE